jgi:hypothetical protein
MPAPEPIPDLLKAVNEASGKAFALWITFLTVGIYLAIAIGTTPDAQLIVASSGGGGVIKLPILAVDLPVNVFYVFAPPLFFALHLYVLMQLYLLARLLRQFDHQLQRVRLLEQDRGTIRDQLDKFVFTQSLIGAPQDELVRWFLSGAVNLSFVTGPVFLLLGFLWILQPFAPLRPNSPWLPCDLCLLFLLWPKISGFAPSRGLRVIVVLLFALSFGLTWGSQILPSRPLSFAYASLNNFPLAGKYLTSANFFHASLVGTDLRRASLARSNLVGADLTRANLSDVNLTSAGLFTANLTDADLTRANLSYANLSGANLSGVKNVTQQQLDEACGNTDTKLPPGLTLKPCPWPQ